MNFRNRTYKLDDDFHINYFTDLSTAGDGEDYIGREVSTKKSRNVTQSVPMLLTILSGREPINCKFAFTIDNYAGTIEIRSNGTIAVLHGIGIFKLISPMEKIIISIHFILRLKKLYKKWENFDSKIKYPSDDDFLKIVTDCKAADIRIYDINDIINKYKNKRLTSKRI